MLPSVHEVTEVFARVGRIVLVDVADPNLRPKLAFLTIQAYEGSHVVMLQQAYVSFCRCSPIFWVVLELRVEIL